jgi:lipid-A-disaccharide synthase
LTLRIAMLAGEPSGDLLGAELMQALKANCDDIAFDGVGGERMRAAGLASLAPFEGFAVNGFVEPLRRLPALWRTFRALRAHWLVHRPDVFVGVDFNVFNLILERSLRKRGIRTVHYVSPSVYAWRRGRVKRIGRSADLVLTLFPFEPAFYEERGVAAEYVGHPLADEIGFEDATSPARASLGLDAGRLVVALLPGSRRGEIELHGELFLSAAERVNARRPACFLIPCVSPGIEARMRELARVHSSLDVRVLSGGGRAAIAACDVALVKSGTGALEAMLLGKPMVVTYRLPALSYRIVKMLFRSPFVALPNILAGRALVPELIQDAAQPEALAAAVLDALEHGGDALPAFRALHASLRRNASARAADAVLRVAGATR